MIELVPENKTEIRGKKLIRVEVHPNPGKGRAGPYLTPVYEHLVDEVVNGVSHPRFEEVLGENWYLDRQRTETLEALTAGEAYVLAQVELSARELVSVHARHMSAVFGWFMERDDVSDSIGVR